MWRNSLKLFSGITIVFCFLTLLSFNCFANAEGNSKSINTNTSYRALLIGNYSYGGESSLNGPPYDISRLKQVLNNSRFGQEKATCSINVIRNANKIQILNAISSTFKDAAADDVSIFYYSGHGSLDNNGNAVICPINDSYINVNELENDLDAIPGTKVVILDSCFSGGFISKNMASKDTIYLDNNKTFNESVISAFTKKTSFKYLTSDEYKVLTASSSSESAADINYIPGWGYGGEFTNSLVKGCGYISNYYPADINDNGAITLNEAYNYTKKNVKYSHVQVYPYNDYSYELFGTKQIIEVTAVTLSETSISVDIGISEQLKAYITPNNATNMNVNWSSSNSMIAEIDNNGIITGVRAGECVVTVQTVDGEYIASCSVQVKDEAIMDYQKYIFRNSDTNTDVALDKTWNIKFSKSLNPLTVNNKNIYISQKDKEIVLCNFQTSSDGKSITLTPQVNYKPDTDYQIHLSHNIEAMDGSKLKSGVLASFKTQSDSEFIQKPVGVVATEISASEINLYWDKVSNAEYYHVYRSKNAEGPYIAFKQRDETLQCFNWHEECCVNIYGYEPNTTVYYKVTAVRNGVESDFSDLAYATTEQDCSSQCLSIVQNGHFNIYPNKKVKIAFEEFFCDSRWEYFVSTDNEHVVEFVGNCLYNNEPVTVLMQFVVNTEDETFEVCYTEQNGRALTEAQYESLLDAIYEQDKSNQCLCIVQNGHFNKYPNKKVKIAFEEFFGDPRWEYFVSTDNKHVVEFVGTCRYNNEPVTVLMQFLVNTEDETFEVCYTEQNGRVLTQAQYESLLEAIYEQDKSIDKLSAINEWDCSEQSQISIRDNSSEDFVSNGIITITNNKGNKQDKSIDRFSAINKWERSEQSQISIHDTSNEDFVPNGMIKISNNKRE